MWIAGRPCYVPFYKRRDFPSAMFASSSVNVYSSRTGKIHHPFKFGKSTILYRPFSIAMSQITGGYPISNCFYNRFAMIFPSISHHFPTIFHGLWYVQDIFPIFSHDSDHVGFGTTRQDGWGETSMGSQTQMAEVSYLTNIEIHASLWITLCMHTLCVCVCVDVYVYVYMHTSTRAKYGLLQVLPVMSSPSLGVLRVMTGPA